MTNTTKIKDLPSGGTAAVNDYFVGERTAGTTQKFTYAPKLNMDSSPQLAGNLDLNGKNVNSTTPTEIGYLHGVTSSIQTQLNTKATTLGWINVKDYGAVGDATTDDTTAIQNALNAASGLTGGVVYFPPGGYKISSTLTCPTTSGKALSIIGAGRDVTYINRATAFTSGDLLQLSTLYNVLNEATTIQGITFNSANINVTSGAGIKINNRGYVSLKDIYIFDGYDGLYISGNSVVISCDNVRFHQIIPTYKPHAGILCKGGHQTEITLNNCQVNSQNGFGNAFQATYGLRIECADGFQATNCFFSADRGISIASDATQHIDDVFFSNCSVDSCNYTGVELTGTAGTGSKNYMFIRFDGCHINPINSTVFNNVAVVLTGDCDEVYFNGCDLGQSGAQIVSLAQPALSFSGSAINNINFNNCSMVQGELAASGTGLVSLASGQNGVTLSNNYIGSYTSSLSPDYAIKMAGSNANCVITGNNLLNNTSGGISFALTVNETNYPKLVLGNNLGVTDRPRVATILDTNGNTALALAASSSAVNYVNIANSATGVTPEVQVTGTDTNIGINYRMKNAGIMSLVSTATTPFGIASGTSSQHSTNFAFPNTNATRTVTFPDASGTLFFDNGGANTIYLANGTPNGGAWTAVTGSGSVVLGTSPTIATPNLTGRTNASGPASGNIGQILQSTFTTGTSLTSGTIVNVNSISLIAGNYLVWGIASAIPAGTTTISQIYVAINTANNALPQPTTWATSSAMGIITASSAGSPMYGYVPPLYVSINSTTTYYLNVAITFAVSTCTCNSGIFYVRIS